MSDAQAGSGSSYCASAGSGDVGAACTFDGDCRAGLGCDSVSPKTCKPWGYVKAGSADCPQPGSTCRAVPRYAGAGALGYQQLCLCDAPTADAGTNPSCNPVDPPNPNGGWAACSGGLNCIPGVNSGETAYCATAGAGGQGASCASDSDCKPGYTCDTADGSKCFHWCASFSDCSGLGAVGCYGVSGSGWMGYAGSKRFGVCM